MTLVKTVVNDNGGTAVADDFQAYISGNAVPWSAAQTLSAGTYTASEDVVSGYAASAWGSDCAGDGSVTLGIGEHKTCTITNDDIAATLTLVKTVINDDGGTAVADDFQAYISGNAVPWSAAQTLSVGTYTASEDVVSGYAASAWGGDCAGDGSVTLGIGEDKTCTITNDDIPPQPGTGTPGYWLNHPEVWDGLGDDDIVYINMSLISGQPGILIGDWNNNSVCDGGEESLPLTLDDALEYLKPDKGDKTRTLARSLVAAWLNVLAGNEDDCVHDTIDDAVSLLNTPGYEIGSKLKGKDAKAFWETDGGKDLHTILDEYNNGMRCAPHRDSSDLMLVKTASESNPLAGGSLQYTITISNSGPANATDVTVTDTLDENLTFNASLTFGSSWACINDSQLVTCILSGEIPVGDTAETLNIGVDVNSSIVPGTVIWNWAEVASQEPEYYGRELNNNGSVSITVT